MTTQGTGQIVRIAPPQIWVDIDEREVAFRLVQCVRDVKDDATQQLLFRHGQVYVVELLGPTGETVNEMQEHHVIYRKWPFSPTHRFFREHFRWILAQKRIGAKSN